MKNFNIIVFLCFLALQLNAQGPAIVSESPIMVGSKRTEFRTLIEYREGPHEDYLIIPVQVSHTLSRNLLLGARMPYLTTIRPNKILEESGIGDLQLFGKYQFFRKDMTGKTLRMVVKAVENIGVGQLENVHMASMQQFQSFKSIIVGYETLQYGISNELGVNWVPSNNNHDLRYNLSFGLPVLKPVYPTKQLNLYFDYSYIWEWNTDNHMLMYSQGIQYAKDNLTLDLAIQLPLHQNTDHHMQRTVSIYVGSRLII